MGMTGRATPAEILVALDRPSGRPWGLQYRAVLNCFVLMANEPQRLSEIGKRIRRGSGNGGLWFWVADVKYLNRSLKGMGSTLRLRPLFGAGTGMLKTDGGRFYQFMWEE